MPDLLIEIKQDMPGFNPFFGSWVCRDDLNFLIDVGPANTSERLIASLSALGLERVDYILLTHIHIDHGGALADLLNCYPMARVVCHEKAVRHLTDPSDLWRGSVKVLGDLARAYGKPEPVPLERIIPHTECGIKDLLVLETPGHAIHHLSYTYRGRLFVGEAGGNYLTVNNLDYLRPATPPRFFLDLFLRSIDLLLELEDLPIHYAHFGRASSSHRMLNIFRDQLILWETVIGGVLGRDGNVDEVIRNSIDLLLEKDPNLAAFRLMDPDTRKRERFFMTNGVRGFVEFLKEKDRI
ncbi:MAG: MBL fold metallo-hydrolase [Deltaproteobacteria bacterium]|nr:MBL fold metallo-hydrolase [Deltaproteobacteria bacterium]MBW2048562.1 MBL fold metallo-hydrolase [Deltaproteobacteria bacterium]MBW2110535.1 MBL fold metallo-hydrolase [Deltaproteobacteria bacterium]MBW2352161.1 MBL fold metallo-hydrolase [Deltaproteobacteria bacterium]